MHEYYHVYNRGVEKRDIFLEKRDWDRFLKSLYLLNGSQPNKFSRVENRPLPELDRGDPLVAIGAYCLMPNHFHILAREVSEGGISTFMERLGTSYAKYFNIKYDRVGPLFQGTFKAEHVERDEHLKYLFAYIHLNPVKLIDPKWKENGISELRKAKAHLDEYQYSSYVDYLGKHREENLILNKKAFPKYFSSAPSFQSFIDDWLTIDK